MGLTERLDTEEWAELCLEQIQADVQQWRDRGNLPHQIRPDPYDVIALLVAHRLEKQLKQAQRDTGNPYWDRLEAMDIPIPVVVMRWD